MSSDERGANLFERISGIIVVNLSIINSMLAFLHFGYFRDVIFFICYSCAILMNLFIGVWLDFFPSRGINVFKKVGIWIGVFFLFVQLSLFIGQLGLFAHGIVDCEFLTALVLANLFPNHIFYACLFSDIPLFPQHLFFKYGVSATFWGIFLLLLSFGLNIFVWFQSDFFHIWQEGDKSEAIYHSAMRLRHDENHVAISNSSAYSKVRLDDDDVGQIPKLICPICNHPNHDFVKLCKSCGSEFQKCKICLKSVGEDIVYCPSCNAPYHKGEFLEWLKVKASCKECKTEIDMWEFQKVLAEKYEFNAESLNTCPRCKKIVPKDANFCIYCGFQINLTI